jgi:hypothetical protein
MFEALNTTGEPLTAFETFKPKIIEAEGIDKYEDSPSFQNVMRIEDYLEVYKKAEDRQRATSELLIPFRLSETGERLEKNLGDQRRFLRDYFEKLPGLEEKRSVISSLANLSAFIRTGWLSKSEPVQLEGFGSFDVETHFCFQSLKALNHAIVVGALSRFYDEFREAEETTKLERKNDLAAAIRACTAFSMLWRGGFGGTENVDAVYRNAMREGLPSEKILPLAKRPKEELGTASLHGLKRILWSKFCEKFPTRDVWVKAAAHVPIYGHSRIVGKFLLIVASDDATLDPDNDGLIIKGMRGLSPSIREDSWSESNHFSIEHIAPQSAKSDGWDQSLYEEPQILDRLGNLTLLPSAANSYVNNRSWKHKSLLYQYFCSETQVAADALYATFSGLGLAVSATGDAVLEASTYMPMCKALGACKSDWNLDIVEKRSTRLAEMAYDRVINWLQP